MHNVYFVGSAHSPIAMQCGRLYFSIFTKCELITDLPPAAVLSCVMLENIFLFCYLPLDLLHQRLGKSLHVQILLLLIKNTKKKLFKK